MEDDDYIDYSQPSLVQKKDPNSERNIETEIIRNVLKNKFLLRCPITSSISI